ncbi:MAG: DUF4160 domain-containing protein [Spirochaetia bacterium]|nr:DUF4160 domain-containing protein [Spirochaetia bacterium]
MPKICTFLGISIYMYFDEHNPPHFHALYNDFRGKFLLPSLNYTAGNLPPRIIGLVIEWAELHKEELLDNWNRIKETGKYKKINPLV